MVYPRTRGATCGNLFCELAFDGLSPHARGNPEFNSFAAGVVGSIPARAGQPYPLRRGRNREEVYPRTRGATSTSWRLKEGGLGLSPHARGNLAQVARNTRRERSIPARAGQPLGAVGHPDIQEVYPRTRGATGLRL